jgi:hypothetical protein
MKKAKKKKTINLLLDFHVSQQINGSLVVVVKEKKHTLLLIPINKIT